MTGSVCEMLRVSQGDNEIFRAVKTLQRLPPPVILREAKHVVPEQDGPMEQESAMYLSEPISNGNEADPTAAPKAGTSQQSRQQQPDISMREAPSEGPTLTNSAGFIPSILYLPAGCEAVCLCKVLVHKTTSAVIKVDRAA